MSHWYTVFCKTRSEEIAKVNLKNQGYVVYLPRFLTRRYRRTKLVQAAEPLFPRYLFLKLRDAAQSLAPVRSTRGVSSLVRFGNQPAVIPDGVIKQIRAQEDYVAGMRVDQPAFKSGETVKFVHGPFTGLEAVFSKDSGAERVMVLLNVLGKANLLYVDVDWLMAVD